MGGVVHSVTDAVGLTDYKGQKEARKAATAAAERSTQLTEKQVEFQKKQYADWKAVYGPLQENLGNYYKNLSPDKYSQQAVEQVQVETNNALKHIDTEFAQRGLDDSGIKAATEIAMQSNAANQKANIRANADDIVHNKQMQFLGLGLGQGTQMLGTIGNVASNGANAQAGIASSYNQTSSTLGAASMNALGGAIGTAVGVATLSGGRK